jgi:hypothetical protein
MNKRLASPKNTLPALPIIFFSIRLLERPRIGIQINKVKFSGYKLKDLNSWKRKIGLNWLLIALPILTMEELFFHYK